MGLEDQAYSLGHFQVLGILDFPCSDDFKLVPRLARAPGGFSQGPEMLLLCSPPTSVSGPVAAVCGRGELGLQNWSVLMCMSAFVWTGVQALVPHYTVSWYFPVD